MKITSESLIAFDTSTVNESLLLLTFLSTTSFKPGSKIGILPVCSKLIFDSSISAQTT